MILSMDATLDFPFVESLPKREKSRLAQAWDDFKELKAAIVERGPAVPVKSAAVLLGVHRSRIYQLIESGRFTPVEMHGHILICSDDLESYAREERAAGRPVAFPNSLRESARRGLKFGMSVASGDEK